MSASNLSKVRLLVQHEAELRLVCKLIFTKKDASIYIVPYAPGGHYYFGSDQFAEREAERTFDFKTQLSSKDKNLPHLSLHQRGRVHAYGVHGEQAGPLQIPPLPEWRGQHIATVTVDRFKTLAPFDKTPKSTGAQQDFVFIVEEPLQSGRLALYVNGAEPTFGDDCPVMLTLTRPTLKQPLYLGVRPWGQEPLGETPDKGGVVALAGWDPTIAKTEAETPFLYVRGE